MNTYEHQLREGFGLSSSERDAAALSEIERSARIRHLEHQLDTGAVPKKKRNDIRNELFHLRRAAEQQAEQDQYEREFADRKREQARRKRRLVEQLKQLDSASEQERRAFNAEVRTLAAQQDKRWTQLLAELAEERMKLLEEQVENLKRSLDEKQDELAQQRARRSEAAEAGVRAELSELTQRVLALEQEHEAREQQKREHEAREQQEQEREAREQHARDQRSEQAKQNAKRELDAELSARREYLEKLLYETPGAERARLAEAENKTLSELSGELESLEKQLDNESEHG